jgi:pimeloyl-ACP methyl ester carboxylesterase
LLLTLKLPQQFVISVHYGTESRRKPAYHRHLSTREFRLPQFIRWRPQPSIKGKTFSGGENRMATYVLVHGAFAGGWQWQKIAARLRAAGHDVYTPTLTGLGERVHLATPDVGLDTHTQDILNVLDYEDLHDVILVGYSYSGMVVTGVADCAPERLAKLVYVDAYVPGDGESMAAMMGPETAGFFAQVVQTYGDGWRLPFDPPDTPRMTPLPFKPVGQPVSVTNPNAARLPRTFVYCTQEKETMGGLGVPITQAAARAKTDGAWRYYELQTGHLPMDTALQELGDILLQLA